MVEVSCVQSVKEQWEKKKGKKKRQKQIPHWESGRCGAEERGGLGLDLEDRPKSALDLGKGMVVMVIRRRRITSGHALRQLKVVLLLLLLRMRMREVRLVVLLQLLMMLMVVVLQLLRTARGEEVHNLLRLLLERELFVHSKDLLLLRKRR